MVKIVYKDTTIECRAILDSGSQLNFVTENLVKRIGLQCTPHIFNIEGIGGRKQQSDKRVNIAIKSCVNDFSTRLEAHVLPQIMSHQPAQALKIDNWPIPANIPLADPQFHKPGTIDLLIGAELYPHILCVGQIRLGDELPILQNTIFGWIASGKVHQSAITQATCGIGIEDQALDNNLEKCWMLDESDTIHKGLTAAEERCESHFAQNTTRNAD